MQIDTTPQNEDEAIRLMKIGVPLKKIPAEFRTKQVCLAASRNKKNWILFPAQYYNDSTFIIELVKTTPNSIECVPKDKLSEAICLEAVSENGDAIEFVPKHYRTEDIFKTALSSDFGIAKGLQSIPSHLISKEDIRYAILCRPDAIEFLPQSLITQEVASIAVSCNADTFEHIPQKHWDMALIEHALIGNGGNLQFIPEHQRNEYMYITAIRSLMKNPGYEPIGVLFTIPKDISRNHPLLLAYSSFYTFPEPDEFDALMDEWVNCEYIDIEDIKHCLERTPAIIKNHSVYQKWLLTLD